jgi:hypothetical protein
MDVSRVYCECLFEGMTITYLKLAERIRALRGINVGRVSEEIYQMITRECTPEMRAVPMLRL